MKTSASVFLLALFLFISAEGKAQKIGKVSTKVKSTSSKKRSASITVSPYLLPRMDFLQDKESATDFKTVNLGVSGGLLFRLWFNENWGVFTGAGIAKRQFQYIASGASQWGGEEPGIYDWNAQFRHEKLLVEVQAGIGWQYNFKKKPGSCARFGNRSTGWFFLADLGILLAPEFKNEIFVKGNYERYATGPQSNDLIETTEYPNWTRENEISENNETQVALLFRPAVKYQMKNVALLVGPEFHFGLSRHKDLLNYRSKQHYKVHTLGLFLAAEF
ncbi:MAG: hypothetical protein WD048_04150 [Chitinophagales bacterium]